MKLVMPALQTVLRRFEITIAKAEDLLAIRGYKIAIIADDSDSMTEPSLPQQHRQRSACGQPRRRRWDELRDAIAEIAEVATCMGSDGVDVHFLNREPLRAVTGTADVRLKEQFAKPPSGGKPLTEAVNRLAASADPSEDWLVFVITDGEPDSGRPAFEMALGSLMKSVNAQVRIMTFLPEPSMAQWLGELGQSLPGVEFSDDYFAERRTVISKRLSMRFTRGDWCAKAMLAGLSEKFAAWDRVLYGDYDRKVVCNFCDIM